MTHNDTPISLQPNSPHWLIVDGDLVQTGGMDIANLRLAQYLAESSSLHVVAHRVDPVLANRSNVTLQYVKRPFNAHFLGGYLLDRAGRRTARSLQKKSKVNVIVNGGNCCVPDAINWVHYVHAAYQPENRASGLRRLKNVLHRRQSLRAERTSMQNSRLVICNSNMTAKHVHELIGVPKDRIRVVYYGIDRERFFPATAVQKSELREKLGWTGARKKVLFIGALGDRRKGFDTVADAWEQLSRLSAWEVDLIVVGSGVEMPKWKAHFEHLGLQKSVDFLGFRSDVPDLLRAADALIAPTRYEAYGLGIHEAICCGLPAFVSRDSGVAERYPPDLADKLLLSSPNDKNELFSKLLNWRASVGHCGLDIRPFADEIRSRTWGDMSDEFVRLARPSF